MIEQRRLLTYTAGSTKYQLSGCLYDDRSPGRVAGYGWSGALEIVVRSEHRHHGVLLPKCAVAVGVSCKDPRFFLSLKGGSAKPQKLCRCDR